MKAKRILASVLACLVLMMSMTALASAEGSAVEVATYDELVAAVANGGEIKLTGDISYHNSYTNNKSIKIATGTNVTLDLNGHSLGQYVWDNGASVAAVIVREGATLTVKDTSEAKTGKIHACNTAIQLQGTLYLQSGTISIENPSKYDVNPATGWAYGVWFYMANENSPAPAFYMSDGAITICDEMLAAHEESNFANAVAFNDGVDGVADCYDDAIVEITGGTLNSNIIVGENTQNVTVPETVEVVYYGAPVQIGNTPYATLADAVADAEAGDKIKIAEDLTLTEKIEINEAVEIEGGNHKITTSAQKLFEVYADFSVSDLKMESTHSAGRCVDTRVDEITVSIDNCELVTKGSGWAQALTIGGTDEGGLTVSVTDSKIESSYVSIIMFVPANLTISGSELSGYGTVYAKGTDGNTTGSVITITDSDLTSKNTRSGSSNSFAAIFVEDEGVEVTVDAASTIAVEATTDAYQAAICLSNKASEATIECPVTATGEKAFVVINVNSDSLTVTDPDVIEAVKAEGYNVAADGKVSVPTVNWTTDTDAGFYLEEDTKYGLLRFLFAADVDGEIVESGIKYIKVSNIADKDTVSGITADANRASAFYGDINGIPETEAGKKIAAVAYVITEAGTYWSDAVVGTVDMTSQQFTDYVAGGAQ